MQYERIVCKTEYQQSHDIKIADVAEVILYKDNQACTFEKVCYNMQLLPLKFGFDF